MNLLAKIFGGSSPVKTVADVVDRFVDTKEEKRAFFKEMWTLQMQEKQSARDLYKGDNFMQKLYALTFLLAYLALTSWLVYSIVQGSMARISQFETGLIGSIWGGMTAKVNTITDFFFGSAQEMKNEE